LLLVDLGVGGAVGDDEQGAAGATPERRGECPALFLFPFLGLLKGYEKIAQLSEFVVC
jgi:hypothetical protein